jgi:hypothetical protein
LQLGNLPKSPDRANRPKPPQEILSMAICLITSEIALNFSQMLGSHDFVSPEKIEGNPIRSKS